MKKILVPLLYLIVLSLLVQTVALAQNGSVKGKLYTFGFMFIKWGNPGENQVVLSNSSGFQMTTNSNSKGEFSFSDVPPGSYSITVNCQAELKNLGLCSMTGSTKVTVKAKKAASVSIKLHKM